MLNLKGSRGIQWSNDKQQQKLISIVSTLKSNIKLLNFVLLGFLFISFYSKANYSPVIVNPQDGYTINLSNNTSIGNTPYIGTDGNRYYQIGNPIALKNSSVTGMVKCVGRRWGSTTNTNLGTEAFHRIFIYPMAANTKIDGVDAYVINNNVLMTVKSSVIEWTLLSNSQSCSNPASNSLEVAASSFFTPTNIVLSFYVKDKIIDGVILIPAMDLAGYVRAFMDPLVAPIYNSWPIAETTTPVRILSSTINLNSSCSIATSSGQASTLNLRHGPLSALNYDNLVTEKVSYSCKFSIPTKVNLRLDYITDNDPQKRLPMQSTKNSDDKIYSELKIIDDETGQSGNNISIDIKEFKSITISSHIYGENAAAGDYKGSAWLIATFD